jgi:poly(A) polymerase
MPIAPKTIDEILRSSVGQRAYRIVETLTQKGFDTWWVGGAVRDMLAGKVPKDIDIATEAKPKDVHASFSRAMGGDESFGSARVLLGEEEFEVTTFREDDEASDGRHPEGIVFGSRQQDAKRRDFTVNAMYFQPISRELFDPFNGEGDWKEKLVRFIGEPGTRIKHDALRILRAVRLRAAIDGQYEPVTYAALGENAQLVEILSGERKLSEFEKMLKGPKPERALEDLWELHILQYMIHRSI